MKKIGTSEPLTSYNFPKLQNPMCTKQCEQCAKIDDLKLRKQKLLTKWYVISFVFKPSFFFTL